MWEYLDLVRIYTKPRGVQPDFDDPVVLRKAHSTVEDFCNTIVTELLSSLLNSSTKILLRISNMLSFGANLCGIILVILSFAVCSNR
jgi:hypothetical protein